MFISDYIIELFVNYEKLIINLQLKKKMASVMQRFRDLLGPGSSHKHLTDILEPELGFKISVNESTKELKVSVIGGRHLPSLYGLTRPQGYLVKVCIFL